MLPEQDKNYVIAALEYALHKCINVDGNEQTHYNNLANAIEIVKNFSIPVVSGSFSDDLQSCIDAEKEDRVKRIETFVPAFEDDTICHFFWVKGSKYPLT